MDERERRVLEKHRKSLVSDIADVEPILDHLIAAAVFRADGDGTQRIRAGETARMRARKLLDTLPSCGREAFGHFVDALRSVRSHLADLLTTSIAEIAGDECVKDLADAARHGPPRLANPVARKLQEALCADHKNKGECLPLFDFQPSAQASGLDDVFVTLSALNFGETQAAFHRRKALSAKQVRELASKTWSERQQNAVEITDLSRLLQFPNGRAAKSSLLLARAAGGKTLTLLKMAALWAQGGNDVLAQFEFVFYVSARDTDALSGKSAIEVLRLDEFDLTISQQEEMEDYFSENSHKVLVLLDGADEGGELWSKSKGLQKILQRKGNLRDCSFIVSSRPCEVAYRLIPKCEQHFHLVGLNDCCFEELLRRRLGEAGGQRLSVMLKEARWSQLRELMAETPLVANMVTALAASGLSLPDTATELYTVVVVNMARRARDKAQGSRFSGGTLEELPADAKASLLTAGQLALSGLKEGKYVFNLEKEVHQTCGDLGGLFGLLEEFHSVSLRGERHEAQFCHLTYQEYLAAYAVSQAEDVEKELESCRQAIGFGEETWPFWRFIGGLFGPPKVRMLASFLGTLREGEVALGETTWQILKMTCFAEAMGQPCPEDDDTEALSRCGREAAAFLLLPSVLNLSYRTMSSSEFQAVAVSLAHAENVVRLKVSYCGLNDQHANLLKLHGSLRHIASLLAAGNPNLHGAGLATIASALEFNGQLLVLDVTDSQLNANDSASLSCILARNPVSELYLDLNLMTSEFLQQLQPSLSASRLRVLNLSQSRCRLDNEGARVVGEILAHCDHLEWVHLRGNDLGNDGAREVLRGAASGQGPRCVMNLSGTNLDDGLVPFLSALLTEDLPTSPISNTEQQLPPKLAPRPLRILLYGNKVSPRALQQLADQLPSFSRHQVECGQLAIRAGVLYWRDLLSFFRRYTERGGTGELSLANIGIDDEVVAQVATQLQDDCCSVEALSLDCNSLSDVGISVLAHTLGRNSTLSCLSLAYNNIRRPARLFSILVEANLSLQWLELCGNTLFAVKDEQTSVQAAESQASFARLVAESRGLKYIGLGQTGLGDKECHVLQAALAVNSGSLRFISLGRNLITSTGAAALAQGLEKNTNVQLVNLSYNEIDEDGAAAIAQCVQVRERSGAALQTVWMAGNKCDPSHCLGCVVNSAFFYSDIMSAMEMYLG